MSDPKLTPMMRQYQDIRRGLPPNTLLFFRLGDFYELFSTMPARRPSFSMSL